MHAFRRQRWGVSGTVRKRTTPYPVQVKAFVARLRGDRGAFSAKDVYAELDHPTTHDFKSSIGAINKALHQLWCDGALVAFTDQAGALLRDEEFVAPGSAAVEHPQVFAAPGSPSPRRGFSAVSYASHHRVHSPSLDRVGPSVEAAEWDGSRPVEEAEDSVGDVIAPPDAPADETRDPDTLAATVTSLHLKEPVPDWLPDALLREWVTRPNVIDMFRGGLDKGDASERRQLILTGMGRKGSVRPESAPAAELARLCRRHAIWWDRCSRAALESVETEGRIAPKDLARLYTDIDGLGGEYERDVIVLTSLRLEIMDEEVQVLAAEAAEELGAGAVSFLEEEHNKLRAQVELAQEEVRSARNEARDEKKRCRAAARAQQAALAEVERIRASSKEAGDAASQLAELQEELVELRSQVGALESERDSALDEAERARQLEREQADHESELARAYDELALVQVSLDAARGDAERGRKAEQELQDALRTLGELNVQVEDLRRRANQLPALADARSLVELLDSAIGSLIADASERIRTGAASVDDRQLLAFAAQFVEFKLGLPTVAIAVADLSPGDKTSLDNNGSLEIAAAVSEPLTSEPPTSEPPTVDVD